MTEQLLTPAELAEHFGVSQRTLIAWAKQYAWPRTQIGRRIRWTPEQVEQIKRQHAVTPTGVTPADGRTSRSRRSA